ncbi:hypothetical protein, partial [Vibrio echinoideorum]
RNLAKVEVIGSNPMYRSKSRSPNRNVRAFLFLLYLFFSHLPNSSCSTPELRLVIFKSIT